MKNSQYLGGTSYLIIAAVFADRSNIELLFDVVYRTDSALGQLVDISDFVIVSESFAHSFASICTDMLWATIGFIGHLSFDAVTGPWIVIRECCALWYKNRTRKVANKIDRPQAQNLKISTHVSDGKRRNPCFKCYALYTLILSLRKHRHTTDRLWHRVRPADRKLLKITTTFTMFAIRNLFNNMQSSLEQFTAYR